MLQIEILICECLGAVDGSTTGAIAVEEVSTLDHEVFDLLAFSQVFSSDKSH